MFGTNHWLLSAVDIFDKFDERKGQKGKTPCPLTNLDAAAELGLM